MKEKSRFFARSHRLFLVFLFLSTVAGCAYMQPTEYRLLQWSRYSELQRHMEKKIPDVASAKTHDLFNLCYAYVKVKNYEKGLHCADELERNIQEGDTKLFGFFDVSSTPYLIRAEAALDFGDYAHAVEEAKKGYEIAVATRAHKQFLIYALGELSLAHALTGNKAEAEKYAKLLEKISTFYPDNGMKPDKMNALARTYMALGDYSRALKKLRATDYGFSLVANVITGTSFVGESIFTYNELPKKFMTSKCLYETGRASEAKSGYEKLLKHPGTASNGDVYWMILFDMGRISEAEGDLNQAVDYYEKAVAVFEEQRSTIRTEASKIGYVGSKQAVYHRLIAALFSQARHGKAFEYVERAKSRALVDLLAEKKGFAVRRGDPKEIEEILKKLDSLEAEGRIQETTRGLDQTRQTRSAGLEMMRKLQTDMPELASLVSVRPIALEKIQAGIEPDEALIEYFYTENDLYAFVVTKEKIRAVTLEEKGLAEEVRQFREALEDPDSSRYADLAGMLHRKLIKPLEPLNHAKLIVVPHGILHYLPFHALGSEKDFLIDRYSIRYLPSASVMEFLARREASPAPKLMAIGNPELQGRKSPLAFAENEARAVAEAFPESTVAVRNEATESLFKQVGGHFDYIHLATHGVFDPENPLHSGLLLAEDGSNDGILTAEELYSVNLAADLVTLSACETALAQVANGDDLVGLARGFLYAGAKAIVASLWSVDDESTSFLMSKFYAELKTRDKQEALRQAQLAAKEKYGHPFYWAAFELTGMP